ncbi:AAA domain [Haematococcus lacustris]|uniref:AAA domain n=1 Tax=Haematococcus lacustris TaxID=44745 RepID=A0A6A0A828_HAELA|nr:AAA domain [Haematococcus lacustris]
MTNCRTIRWLGIEQWQEQGERGRGAPGAAGGAVAAVELLKQKFLDASSSSAASAANPSKQAAKGTAQSQGQGSGSDGSAQGIIVVTAPAAGHVQVASVDGFQGREKEVIVFSTVRSNAGEVGTKSGTGAQRGVRVC